MKKIIIFLSLVVMLTGGMFRNSLQAQVPMPIPNGSFEQWTSHQGYSVSVLFIPFSVYSAYSTPSVWNYPSYAVNETVSLMGMNVNINTSIPLVKASQDTAAVPDSSLAVKLQTFMLSDIVSSTVLNLAGDYIDSSLTNQVIPSILLTGEVNIDALIPLLTNLMSDAADITTLIPTLLAADVNDYITGGLPLGDFRPGRLTGSYKFHSATGGDNGGVVLVGTRYNNVTHQRDIVGAGLNIALSDTSVYTPFEVEYLPLGELFPGSPNREPDSLIVILVSSASSNMQQGSYLCLDNLMLWPAPDTCAAITSFTAHPQIHEAVLEWSITDSADSFEIEYGPAGFAIGSGDTATTTATSLALDGLDASTAYDAYVRTLCSDTIYGDWSAVQFITLADTCASVLTIATVNQADPEAFPETVLTWESSSDPEHWEVEYGPRGFEFGTGTIAVTTEPSFEIYPLERAGILRPNTVYTFRISSVCSNGVYGSWAAANYRTYCATVSSLSVDGENTTAADNDHISGYSVTWVDSTDTRNWRLSYGITTPDSPQEWETIVEVDTTYYEFPPLLPETSYTVSVRALCDDDNFGMEQTVSFTTGIVTSVTVANDVTLTISPNPAQGQCEVSVSDNRPAELRLFSADGRMLQTVVTEGQSVVLQLPSHGLFLLHATTAEGTTTHKIINQ